MGAFSESRESPGGDLRARGGHVDVEKGKEVERKRSSARERTSQPEERIRKRGDHAAFLSFARGTAHLLKRKERSKERKRKTAGG